MTTETRRQAQLARQRECCETARRRRAADRPADTDYSFAVDDTPEMTTDTRPMMVGTYRLRWSPATEEGPGCWEVLAKP